MFVGCSEISISVIVKHLQHGIIRGFFSVEGWGDLLHFSVPGGTENIAGLWVARGDQYTG